MATSSPPPPPPLDDPQTQDPLECPPLRWGLIGCGRVSHDFAQALKHLRPHGCSVVACSTRNSIERAQEFAQKHHIAHAYGSYEELLADEQVEIVYVGNVHAFRRDIAERVLSADKHLLLEKPFACTAEDAEYIIQLAKKKNKFCMEGMWTRFFPAVEMARQIVHQGQLGEIVSVYSDFNFNASDSEEYPTSFFYNRKLGGGASLLVAPYPIAAATLFYPQRYPEQIKVVGQFDQETGVDLQASISISYAATGNIAPAMDDQQPNESTPKLPGAGIATLCYGILGESVEQTTVVGTKGRLAIHAPGHCPTKLSVAAKLFGRGKVEHVEYNFALPEDTPEIIEAGGYFYPNSAGFAYEAAAVARCIHQGKTEAPQYTLTETSIGMSILHQVREQLGIKSIYDN